MGPEGLLPEPVSDQQAPFPDSPETGLGVPACLDSGRPREVVQGCSGPDLGLPRWTQPQAPGSFTCPVFVPGSSALTSQHPFQREEEHVVLWLGTSG